MTTKQKQTENTEAIRLSTGDQSFVCGLVEEDQLGAIHASDSRGSGYTRCDLGVLCDHHEAPEGSVVWHDDEYTETLWEGAI